MAHWSLKRFTPNLLSWCAALFLAGSGCIAVWYDWCVLPLSVPTAQTVYLPPGVPIRQVLGEWSAQVGIPVPYWWWRYAVWEGWVPRAEAVPFGEYLLLPGMTAADLAKKLGRGQVLRYPLRLEAGWDWHTVQAHLEAHGVLSGDTRSWPADGGSPEGLLYPDTYYVSRGESFHRFLARGQARLWRVLQDAWSHKSPGLPYTSPYQALIAASIIEKETAIAEERFRVAGVLVRRLVKGMPLQMDPTLLYGKYRYQTGMSQLAGQRRLTRSDLQADHPYNTYRRTGLPPTPIALVSPEAIQAALHPAEETALYFVATGKGDHVFSDTLVAHRQAVSRLRDTEMLH